MIYSNWLKIADSITLSAGRTLLINDSAISDLMQGDDSKRESFDIKIVVTSGIPTEGSLIGIHLKYIDEPMPMAGYNPRFRGRIMTDKRLGTYHSIDLIKLESEMQLCLKSNEKETELVITVYVRTKG